MNNWNERLMYHPEFSPLGFHGKEDYWNTKEDREEFWPKQDGRVLVDYSHAPEHFTEIN